MLGDMKDFEFIHYKLPNSAIKFDPQTMLDALSEVGEGGRPSLYDSERKVWKNWPDTSSPPPQKLADGEETIESRLASYISHVAEHVADRMKINMPMRWDDMVVLDRMGEDSEDAIKWDSIHARFELKCNNNRKKAKFELIHCARLMFGHQVDRRFVLAVKLFGTTMSLMVLNRSGTVASADFDVHKRPELFLRVAIGLLFLDRTSMGYDPTISPARDTIQVNTNTYHIKSIIYQESVVRGRGTVCLEVEKDGQTFVIKDYWLDDSRGNKEWTILDDAKDVDHVTDLVEYEELEIGDVFDSTANDMHFAKVKRTKEKPETRQHVRMVLTPYGRPIWKFHNKRELLQAFIDVIDAHEKLYKEKGILHRDISWRNILITSLGRGLLIDMDFAIRVTELERKAAIGPRTGTVPFMAIAILRGLQNHEPRHDLESLFYVLCWMGITRAGPNRPRPNFDLSKSELASWCGMAGETFKSVANAKQAVCSSEDMFKISILAEMHPYFHDLRDCLSRLQKRIFTSGFPSGDPIDHAQMRDIFQGSLDSLSVEDTTDGSDPSTVEETSSTTNEATPNDAGELDRHGSKTRSSPADEYLNKWHQMQPESKVPSFGLKRSLHDVDEKVEYEEDLCSRPTSGNFAASIGSAVLISGHSSTMGSNKRLRVDSSQTT
ncbi:hypothetical protein BD410DRAFT_892437 [Rickenella mellea]|uniref:Protein kinase domain-containing protein n=1 Tax=Rickenella mellea TaxID=50990 RepID=A0A4R5XEA0_9AGAM|nr:hypothetical protein BD410DRAFT_892437 [Rickenella mellea]